MSASNTVTDAAGANPAGVRSLLSKLHACASDLGYVEKRGVNQAQRYRFAQHVDVVRDVRDQLNKHGVIVTPAVSAVHHEPYQTKSGATHWLTTVRVDYTFRDVESGASIVVPWAGVGSDNGDKGIYKAMTGSMKYALLSLFLLPTTDDPERDALSSPERPQGTVAKDADRPAAPRIPIDRAREIAEAAVRAGLASWQGTGNDRLFQPSVVLKAKLADVGVAKIGSLNVDQAEAVEAFIAHEAAVAEDAPQG